MSLRARGPGTVWWFPAVGFAAMAIFAFVPGSTVSPAAWPAREAFGAFTWVSWFFCSAMAATLLLISVGEALRAGRSSWRLLKDRALPASAAFAMLAISAYTAASRVEQIRREPSRALVVAMIAAILSRIAVDRIVSTRTRAGADVAE